MPRRSKAARKKFANLQKANEQKQKAASEAEGGKEAPATPKTPQRSTSKNKRHDINSGTWVLICFFICRCLLHYAYVIFQYKFVFKFPFTSVNWLPTCLFLLELIKI